MDNQEERRRCRADIFAFFGRAVLFVFMMYILFGWIFGITPMNSGDMTPRICAGDLMLYYRLEKDWNNSDIIVFEKDNERYTGRIVARGGDTVEITEEAALRVNGSQVFENDIYYTTPRYESDVAYPLTLGENELFVLCDFREGGRDSRYFGPVKQDEIQGKVITAIRRSGL